MNKVLILINKNIFFYIKIMVFYIDSEYGNCEFTTGKYKLEDSNCNYWINFCEYFN